MIGKQYQTAFGGKGANQAVACGRSGADITFIACVGMMPSVWKSGAAAARPYSHRRSQRGTGSGYRCGDDFVNEDGENVIGISAGANAALTPAHFAPYKGLVEQSDALLMQLESPLETVIAAAQAAKIIRPE